MSSRQALLQWVNDLLQLNYVKLDQLGTGAAYCQIMDAVYHDVPMQKVKFDSTLDYDNQNNYKILQAVFNKHGVSRNFDQQRLLKCRLQDNLEFVQWIYKFWSENASGEEYDAPARRRISASRTSMAPSRLALSRTGSRASVVKSTPPVTHTPTMPAHSPATSATNLNAQRSTTRSGSRAAHTAQAAASRLSVTPSLRQSPRVAELEGHVDELEHTINVVTAERTLYYGKLLQIEELLQTRLDELYALKGDSLNDEEPQVELVRTIQSILYATAEGFQTPYRPEDEPF